MPTWFSVCTDLPKETMDASLTILKRYNCFLHHYTYFINFGEIYSGAFFPLVKDFQNFAWQTKVGGRAVLTNYMRLYFFISFSLAVGLWKLLEKFKVDNLNRNTSVISQDQCQSFNQYKALQFRMQSLDYKVKVRIL